MVIHRWIKWMVYNEKCRWISEGRGRCLKDLFQYSLGKDLPKGDARTSTFWLVDKNEVVRVVRIRHQEVECAGRIGYDISPQYRNVGYGFNWGLLLF